ncbi:MAG TPA: antibiotic biosynthesis monooxygenase [Methanomicrobiales archaeon]|nr:antibiotic biosynthesis monooxygenase [Methanomicrobiales archaeon]
MAGVVVHLNPGSLLNTIEALHAMGRDMTYLRVTVRKWTIDLDSREGQAIFQRISEEGVRVFRKQPGFIQYRLVQTDNKTTIAVAEWENEDLGKSGARHYRDWLKSSGIAERLTLTTRDGPVVASS